MTIVKHAEGAPVVPPKPLIEAINQLAEEATKAGCVIIRNGGLLPINEGTRIRLAGGRLTVTDGPFTEAKEVIGGFAIFEAPSKADVVKWSASWTCTRYICPDGRARPKSDRCSAMASLVAQERSPAWPKLSSLRKPCKWR